MLTIKNHSIYLLFSFIWLLFSSCDNSVVYEKYADFDEQGWRAEDSPLFDVEIKDTSLAYNLIFNVRNTKEYGYRNLWILIETTYPDATFSKDSLNLFLSDEHGKELGKCSSSMCENAFLVNKQGPVKFKHHGVYSFRIEHLMRAEGGVLKHIRNVGIRLEKSID